MFVIAAAGPEGLDDVDSTNRSAASDIQTSDQSLGVFILPNVMVQPYRTIRIDVAGQSGHPPAYWLNGQSIT